MAVTTWLKRSEMAWLDLDALLAVELPATSTPRTLERIVSTEYLAIPPYGKVSEAMVKDRSGVTWLTPMLQRTVGDFFGNPKTYTGYLCTARKAERKPCSAYEAEAATLFEAQRGDPLRSLLRSEEDLMALLEFLVKKIVYPLPPEGEAARAEQIADGKQLERLRGELARAKATLEAAGEPPPEPLSGERVRLEEQIAGIMKRYHDARDEAAAWRTKSRVQVSGGISLRPEEFTIRRNPASPALQKFKRLAQGAAVGAVPGGGRLVRSRPTGKIPRVAGRDPSAAPGKAAGTPRPAPPAAVPSSPAAAATRAPKVKAAEVSAGKTGPPSVAAVGPARVPALVAARIAIPAGAAGAAQALGELAADGRIVFRRAPR
jgi:hypothetical protein